MTRHRELLMVMIVERLKGTGLEFGKDPQSLPSAITQELNEWAKAVDFKASKASCMSRGNQFYDYLSRFAK